MRKKFGSHFFHVNPLAYLTIKYYKAYLMILNFFVYGGSFVDGWGTSNLLESFHGSLNSAELFDLALFQTPMCSSSSRTAPYQAPVSVKCTPYSWKYWGLQFLWILMFFEMSVYNLLSQFNNHLLYICDRKVFGYLVIQRW